MQEYLEGGKILNTFGIRGEVKIEPWCDSAEFLKKIKTLYVDGAPRRVLSARVHKGMLIVLFEGVEDVNAAMLLKNKVVSFARKDVRLPKGRFFISDIMESRVVDEDGREVGLLTDVIELPRGRVFVVTGTEEHTIPDVPEFIREINAEEKLIRVHMIEGM